MNIAILGFGTVGVGVYDLMKSRTDLCVKYVLDLREFPELGSLLTHDVNTILSDPEVDTVIEVMGGLHPSFEFVSAALNAGKHVVTANKYLISTYFRELTALAAQNGVCLRCTAAAGGGIPWLVNLERAKRVDRITRLGGIMNGTTNFIMDAMQHRQMEFADALSQAQALGYAEADPSADIDGWDIQRKLAISANIAFDCLLRTEDIPCCGIRNITAEDVQMLATEGLSCRLLASGQRNEGSVSAYVEPTLLADGSPEAAVPSNFNLITFTGEAVGRLSFFGQGAGRYPTACNCVQDCVDIANGCGTFYSAAMKHVPVDNDAVSHAYYVRTAAPDGWLQHLTRRKMGSGVITEPVSVRAMHEWLQQALLRDPGCFIAGLL